MSDKHHNGPDERNQRPGRFADSGPDSRRPYSTELPSRPGRRPAGGERGRRPPVDPDLASMLTSGRLADGGAHVGRSAEAGTYSGRVAGSGSHSSSSTGSTPHGTKPAETGKRPVKPDSLSARPKNLWPDSAPPAHGKPMQWPGTGNAPIKPPASENQPGKRRPETPARSTPSPASAVDGVYVPEIIEETPHVTDTARPLPKWTRIEPSSKSDPSGGESTYGNQGAGDQSTDTISQATRQLVRIPAVQPLFPGGSGHGDSQNDVGAYLRIFRRRSLTMLIVALLVWGAVATYVALVPPSFEASSTLLVDTRGFQEELEDLPRLTGERQSLGVPKVANQALILQSSFELAERAAQTLRTMNAEGTGPSQWTLFDGEEGQSDRTVVLVTRLREDYVQVIPQAGDDDGPDAITITAQSTVPAEASLIANVFSRTYIQSVDELTASHFDEALQYYRSRLDQKIAETLELEGQIRAFAQEGGDLLLAEDANHLLTQIALLRTGLDEARIQITEYEATIGSIEEEMSGMGEQLVAERVAYGLEDQISSTYERIAEINLETELFYTRSPELRQDPSPSKELVRLLDERSQLTQQVDQLNVEYANQIVGVGGIDLRSQDGTMSYMATMRRQMADNRVKLAASTARESAILSRLVQYEEQRKILPARTVDYAELTSRHQRNNEQLVELEDRVQAIEDASQSRRTFARVVSPALVPDSPVRSPMMIVVLGLMFGLLMGIGAGFARERFDDRIFESTILDQDELDMIGSIPEIRGIRRRKTSPFFDRMVTTDLVTLLQPQSPASRAIRSIPMRLRGERRGIRTMVFAGIDRGDGASFASVNTASVLAQSGLKVLLLDVDMDRPAVARMLGLSDKAQLDLESGAFAEGHGIEGFSVSLPNLFCLSLSGPTDGTADYLLSAHLIPIIERVRGHFDVVVIDAPPTSESTSALGLSHISDETILVARSARTGRTALRERCEDFRRASGRPPRVVLNGHRKA